MTETHCEECGVKLTPETTGFSQADLHVCLSCMNVEKESYEKSYVDIKKSLSENGE